jgi:glycosyltransferase involved in cell wall biosynthesis
MTTAKAAVVVPTRDRADRVARLLDALAAQQEAPPFEVVVVDDGSTDDTARRVEAASACLPYPLRLVRQEAATGPAGARNRGWHATEAPIVAFTDDDCVPTPSWLAALSEALDGADVVAGRTTFPAEQADQRGTWSYWMEDDGETGHYSTCNVAYRRAAIEAVGGFDEEGFRYRTGGGAARCVNGEDTDLAWRVIDAGFRPGAAPRAVVHHDVFRGDWRAYLRNVRRLEGLVLLFKKHPHLRAEFGKEFVYRTNDAAALAVVAGIGGMAIPKLRPLAAAGTIGAIAWYTRLFRRFFVPPRAPGGYLVAVPLGIVADAYAGLVMARASIRHRTVLL